MSFSPITTPAHYQMWNATDAWLQEERNSSIRELISSVVRVAIDDEADEECDNPPPLPDLMLPPHMRAGAVEPVVEYARHPVMCRQWATSTEWAPWYQEYVERVNHYLYMYTYWRNFGYFPRFW